MHELPASARLSNRRSEQRSVFDFIMNKHNYFENVTSLFCRATLLAILSLFITVVATKAQTPAPSAGIQGTVVNGSNQKPVANADVHLVFMMKGTTPVESKKTDASGRFRLDTAPPGGGAPALIRVDYQGATYSQPLMPGQSSSDVKVEVFEASHDKSIITEKDHAIYFHPSGDTLMILEQVWLENQSSPPKALVNEQGTYTFRIPSKAKQDVRVTVIGPGGMPIGQPVTPGKSDNSFSINYALRPGETQIRLEYGLDYKDPYSYSKVFDFPPSQLQLVTPGKGVTLSGDGITSLGTDPDTGFMGFKAAMKGNQLKVSVSGDMPQPAATAMGGEGDESTSLTPIPDQVSVNRWMLLTGFGIVLLAGFIYHFRRA
jgi:hypothetical protein